MIEEWKTIVDYPDYEISSFGRIKKNGRELTAKRTGKYLGIDFYQNGKLTRKYINRVVFETFVAALGIKQINHIDGNRYNNHLDNLEAVTAKENIRHAYKTGLRHKNRVGKPFLTDAQVKTIRWLQDNWGISTKELSKVFDRSTIAINRILARTIYTGIILCACFILGCVSKKEIKASIWLNNSPIPEEICLREPDLRNYGFYRRLDNGKIEFISWCNKEASHWLSIFDKDLERILKATLPEDTNGSTLDSSGP